MRNTIVHSYDYKTFYSENSYIAFGDTMGYIAGLDSIYTLTRGRKKSWAFNYLGNVILERPLISFFKNSNLCRLIVIILNKRGS